MKAKIFGCAVWIFVSIGAAASAAAPIQISYQPALYGVSIEIAKDQGWFQEIGLDPSYSIFASGAPQIAAGAAGAWDVGTVGAPPAVLGATRMGLLTIGIATEEGGANILLARKNQIDDIKKDPRQLLGKSILVPTNSTAEYAAWACISKLGLKNNGVSWVNLSPPQLVSAFSGGAGTLAAIFTPYAYTIEHKANAEDLCSAKDVGLKLFSTIVVRAEYAKDHPDDVEKFLATYLRAVAWEKKHPNETITYLKKFYIKNGVQLDDADLRRELTKDRQQYTLDQQLAAFSSNSGESVIDASFQQFEQFMIAKGSIQQSVPPSSFVTDQYLKAIEADPKLKAWANLQ